MEKTKKNRPLKVRIIAWVFTVFLILIMGLPFIAVGLFAGWLIWK